MVIELLVGGLAVWIAGGRLSGVHVKSFAGAVEAAAFIGVLNALLPPVVAAVRLSFTLVSGFLIVLAIDAGILLTISALDPADFKVDSFGAALLAALLISAASLVLQVIIGVNDDDAYSLRVIARVARRQGERVRTDAPGILFLEIDGLTAPVLRGAMPDGSAPMLARWLGEGPHAPIEWETDLSSQTGASQAGILLGSNEDIPAFRWVEKETGRMMTCSAPADCAEIERRHTTGRGLLVGGGASRGNLLSGEADEVILDRQPDGRRQVRQPRLSRVSRQRLQRHPRAGPVRVGGRARVLGCDPPGPPQSRAPGQAWRPLPLPPGGGVRGRP